MGTQFFCQVESLMVQRDELMNRSHELESTIVQLKAKDGQLFYVILQSIREWFVVHSSGSRGVVGVISRVCHFVSVCVCLYVCKL